MIENTSTQQANRCLSCSGALLPSNQRTLGRNYFAAGGEELGLVHEGCGVRDLLDDAAWFAHVASDAFEKEDHEQVEAASRAAVALATVGQATVAYLSWMQEHG
jgi:hypothetical protein